MMLRSRLIRPTLPAILLVALLAPAAAHGQVSRRATLNATVPVQARLSLSAATLTFPDVDPDLVPQIPPAGGPVTIVAKARAAPGATVELTVLATDDLRSGLDVIPAAALTWTATGPGFVGGTLAVGLAQPVGTWLSSGSRTGTQAWRLANSWAYAPGTYSLTLTYTLVVP